MLTTSSKSCFYADFDRPGLHKSKFFSSSHDEDSQKAMMALANTTLIDVSFRCGYSPPEGNLRAMGRSEIEKTLQVPEARELLTTLSNVTERAGLEPKFARRISIG